MSTVVEPLQDSVIWTVTNILISFHGNYNIQESIVSEWTLDQTVRVKQYMCIEYWLWEGLSINFAYWKHGQSDKWETILDVSIMDDVRTVKQVSDWNHGVDDYIRSMNWGMLHISCIIRYPGLAVWFSVPDSHLLREFKTGVYKTVGQRITWQLRTPCPCITVLTNQRIHWHWRQENWYIYIEEIVNQRTLKWKISLNQQLWGYLWYYIRKKWYRSHWQRGRININIIPPCLDYSCLARLLCLVGL